MNFALICFVYDEPFFSSQGDFIYNVNKSGNTYQLG